MKIIGLTGGTGAGKTTALFVLKEMGAGILDCDDVYHELLDSSKDMLSAIEERFPTAVSDGELDRKKLGATVFSDAAALDDLNKITHPFVLDEVRAIIEKKREKGYEIIAMDAVALIESGLNRLCDVVVGITAPVDARVRRVTQREGISEEYARLRIAAQQSDDFYQQHCDVVLHNGGSRLEFEEKCREYFESILRQV